MNNCRAMRQLKPDLVPEELPLKLPDAGNAGPTGSNMQNVRWVILRDPEPERQLANLNREGIMAYIENDPVVELPSPLPREKRDRMRDA